LNANIPIDPTAFDGIRWRALAEPKAIDVLAADERCSRTTMSTVANGR
jgi:hypothetical protein